ncbi:MAG: hypothetical protein KAQ98_14805 [Bacteriovoracaceae bacterium]|nr:hypothetical protein [Bacteriovoracaceae bacterium]
MFFNNYDIEYYSHYGQMGWQSDPEGDGPSFWIILFCVLIIGLTLFATDVLAGVPRLPGSDQIDKLQAAGSLLRIIDSFLFKFGARIMAGLAVLAGGWSVKEMAFGRAVLCIIAAIVIGTAPMWVKNIFEMGGGTLFSMIEAIPGVFYA